MKMIIQKIAIDLLNYLYFEPRTDDPDVEPPSLTFEELSKLIFERFLQASPAKALPAANITNIKTTTADFFI